METKDLIVIEKEIPMTTTKIISNCTGLKHQVIMNLVRKYKNRYFTLSLLKSEEVIKHSKDINGNEYDTVRKETYFLLNEEEATFLITLLKNSQAVLDFKSKLVKEFYKMRLFIQEHISFIIQDKEHQKKEMDRVKLTLPNAKKLDYIKINTITNKAVSNLYNEIKMIKKDKMTEKQLKDRQIILDTTTSLYLMKETFNPEFNVKEFIYGNIKKLDN